MLIAEWTFVLMKEYFFLDYLQLDLILDIFIFQITMLAVMFFLKGLAKLLILIELTKLIFLKRWFFNNLKHEVIIVGLIIHFNQIIWVHV
jgi:hypothetical protein